MRTAPFALLATFAMSFAASAEDAGWRDEPDMAGHAYTARAEEPVTLGWTTEGGSLYGEDILAVFRKDDRIGFSIERVKGNDAEGHAMVEIVAFFSYGSVAAGNYAQQECTSSAAPEGAIVQGISAEGELGPQTTDIPLIAAAAFDLESGAMTPLLPASVQCPFMGD